MEQLLEKIGNRTSVISIVECLKNNNLVIFLAGGYKS